jgi:hypothetical protein
MAGVFAPIIATALTAYTGGTCTFVFDPNDSTVVSTRGDGGLS